MSLDYSAMVSAFNAIQPIVNFVSPIAMASVFLFFIRSFFD